ncbi:class I SAM-dependent methyltransferase [Streptomyces sp. ISL-94]|uniref:class I SAM-dependent methyltransferase n=1 Tax=Streptomyces sp. ISL-94 TaxID=2819190 RepID=UPI001BE654AA|nr:class I SAM-dependent methyltransferase [Streptomyces sp. ISL-94]MBT2478371.1 class I SAM-dependent methyltransferase [Streptomyces sp. ISL-94]
MPDLSPFLDPQLVNGSLYRDQRRLADRTGALMAAKVSGRPAPAVIASYAVQARPAPGEVLDIGCGRGASTLALTQALPGSRVLAVDASASVLAATRDRLTRHGLDAVAVQADFHRLPVPTGRAALAVAAFCLYHSPRPEDALREIARCLQPGATVILATKSADSYASLDRLVAQAGLDREAEQRTGLYGAFHSANMRAVAARVLDVREVHHEAHLFRFRDLAHTAAYLATSPKYRLPPGLAGDPETLTIRLRDALPDRPVETASVVSYLTAAVPI